MTLVPWLFLIILILLVISPFRFVSPRTYWYVKKIHGPKGLPLLGVGLEFAALNIHEFLDYIGGLMQQYPRITAVWVLGLPSIFLQEPEDVEEAFGSMLHIKKGADYEPLIPWLKEGLLTSTGKKWHTRRKILTPTFHFQILNDSLQTMNQNSVILAEKLLKIKGEPVDIEPLIKLCTLDVICESVMGVTIGAQNNEGKNYVNAIYRLSEIILKRELCFWLFREWMFNLFPIGFEFRKVLKFLHNFSDKVISARKKSFVPSKFEPEQKDLNKKVRRAFLDTIIEFEMDNPNSFSPKDIREEVDTFMFEGHDTTSSAVTFTLLLLGTHQDIQERVVEELYDIFGDCGRSVEMTDLSKMNYLERVIKESLRLYPSVPYISRTLTSDLKLDNNVMVPAGANLVVMPYFLHRNPRFFPDPEKFDPDRFAERETNKRTHPYAYIPFSAGPRNCIGQKFAMMEIKIIISTILRKAHLESVTKIEDLKLLSMLVLRPDMPVILKVTPREALRPAVSFKESC